MKTRRPQIRALDANKVGNACPMTRPFIEVYRATRGAYDMDGWTKSVMKSSLDKVPRDWNVQSESNQRELARIARYVQEAGGRRYGFSRPGSTAFLPVLCFDPGNRAQVTFVKNQLVNKIIPDEGRLWIGFCTRYEGTGGIGGHKAPDGLKNGDIAAVAFRMSTIMDKTEKVFFCATEKAETTVGAGAVGGAFAVIITGMTSPSQLRGATFSGEDLNIVFGVSASLFKNMAKAPKYAKIATKLIKTADKIEDWEKRELVTLAQRMGGLATSAAGSQAMNISLIDVGATTGAAASYVKWNAKIDYVKY